MKKNRLFVVLALFIMFISIKAFFSCTPGNPSEEGATPPPGETRVTGVLTVGAGGAPHLQNEPVSRLANAPLAGYRLYCVTLTEPAVDGSEVSDGSGNVSLVLKTKNPTFGCNIQDASGNGVASLFFNSGANKAQAITGSGGDINLGIIAVNKADGVANANLPSNAVLVTTTPPGAPCPVGTWVGTEGPSNCCSGQDVTVIAWVAKTASGQYIMTFTSANVCWPHMECGTFSQSNIPVTYCSGQLESSVYFDLSCPSKSLDISLTIDENCRTATETISTTGCFECTTGGGCSGCGDVTCTKPSFTATRQ